MRLKERLLQLIYQNRLKTNFTISKRKQESLSNMVETILSIRNHSCLRIMNLLIGCSSLLLKVNVCSLDMEMVWLYSGTWLALVEQEHQQIFLLSVIQTKLIISRFTNSMREFIPALMIVPFDSGLLIMKNESASMRESSDLMIPCWLRNFVLTKICFSRAAGINKSALWC